MRAATATCPRMKKAPCWSPAAAIAAKTNAAVKSPAAPDRRALRPASVPTPRIFWARPPRPTRLVIAGACGATGITTPSIQRCVASVLLVAGVVKSAKPTSRMDGLDTTSPSRWPSGIRNPPALPRAFQCHAEAVRHTRAKRAEQEAERAPRQGRPKGRPCLTASERVATGRPAHAPFGHRAAAACLSSTLASVPRNSTARSNQVSSPKTIAPLPPKTANCSFTFAVIT